MKALLFFILIIFIFLLIRFTLNRVNQFKSNHTHQDPETMIQEEEMVTCEICGIYLPKSEAYMNNSTEGKVRYACSEEHQRQLQKTHSDEQPD